MRRIRSKDTAPEILVRKLVHSLGYRYRLHQADLPGKPDLVFRSRRKVIFVHGCFWHQHKCISRRPLSNTSYWEQKLARNRARDIKHRRKLTALGWKSLMIWECETKDAGDLQVKIKRFLD